MMGSCNGQLSLEARQCLYLMNPATRECKQIAKEPRDSNSEGLAFGFGFDPKTNDYKWVRVMIPLPDVTCKVEVCSLRNKSCVVKDCLSFAAMFEVDHSIELWVMKEYGLEGSWTKLYLLGLFHVLQNPRRWLSAFEVGFNDEAVVHEDRHLLVLCPRSSGEDFNIVFGGQSVLFDGCYVNYRESLVHISQD